MLLSNILGETPSTTGTWISAFAVLLGALTTAYSVIKEVNRKKKELANEKSKVTREDFEKIKEGYGDLSERWEAQAKASWGREQVLMDKVAELEKAQEIDQDRIAELEDEVERLKGRIKELEQA